MYQLVVVGGGAAGFFGAITHAEQGGGSTLILEKSNQFLSKVKISGGGRCNVTHHCFEAKELSKHYPRGEKALIGPFTRWTAADTVEWFESRGVQLKTEADGRMFPVTDDSATVIQCLVDTAQQAGVELRSKAGVKVIHREEQGFKLELDTGETVFAKCILLSTGGTRLAAGARLAEMLGHTLEPPVPSLFTFNIRDERINDLSGVSVPQTEVRVEGTKLKAAGPILITHWGLSGPGILRVSAWGARELAEKDYDFQISVNWLPGVEIAQELQSLRESWGKRQVSTRSPFEAIPKRLWGSILTAAGIELDLLWSQLTKKQTQALINELTNARFHVDGKSLNKDEFVTCGGVKLKDIQMKTMESKLCPGLYFAGEIMDVDGITGGFNFQNAWTSGRHAGLAIADASA